ncbi:OLC1v1025158C1 [Oldenlandia corymbosa var. corymbosa]|uniref:OLC1v1025158C1 n=1 Tax=Oldenlandia corymbosa var. corymbosa TaxID=529605 RepID=A0AAV1C4M2_OLDCO|nr:OLC1v1025158C1 [Oldenlandia corymbosa var. corymbosa]
MGKCFPALGLTKQDCHEMSWIETYPFLLGISIDNNLDIQNFLTNRTALGNQPPFFKWKVDFSVDPILPEGLIKIFKELYKLPPLMGQLGWTIFGGGIMDQIPESQIPFPHRNKLMIM